jgi:4'-phosphopantetheinyl transferase
MPMRQDFKLLPHQIKIYCFLIDNVSCPNHYQILNNEEQQRADRFHFDKHRIRFINSHAIMRKILGQHTQTNSTSIDIRVHPHGKPYLSNHPELKFNLSHSGDYALLAVGLNDELGIDIEQYSHRPYEDMAQKLFQPDELALFEKCTDKTAQFFRFWSAKEAFMKAIGLGLRCPPESFSTLKTLHYNNEQWSLFEFQPVQNYAAALCHTPAITDIQIIKLDK